MEHCKSAPTPMATGVKLLRTDPSDKAATADMDNVPYASAVGALMYAALVTRPDIAFAVTSLCQFMSAPSNTHWQAAKRVMRYLHGTRHYELVYGVTGGQDRQPQSCTGTATRTGATTSTTADRSLAGCSCCTMEQSAGSRASSHSGAVVRGGWVHGSHSGHTEAVWWRTFLTELGQPPTSAITVHSDSQGAIALAKNPEHHKRTKHIDIQHHYVREQVAAGTVVMPHIGTEDMVADMLTKPLAADRHATLAGKMGVRAAHTAA